MLSSPQHAGKHLRELQKTLKNPLSNFGLVLTEGIKRSQRCVCSECVMSDNSESVVLCCLLVTCHMNVMSHDSCSSTVASVQLDQSEQSV